MQYAGKELKLLLSAAIVSLVKFSAAAMVLISSACPVPLYVGWYH